MFKIIVLATWLWLGNVHALDGEYRVIFLNGDQAHRRFLKITEKSEKIMIETCDQWEKDLHCMSIIPDRNYFSRFEIRSGWKIFTDVAEKLKSGQHKHLARTHQVAAYLSRHADPVMKIQVGDDSDRSIHRLETAIRYILDKELRHASCEAFLFN